MVVLRYYMFQSNFNNTYEHSTFVCFLCVCFLLKIYDNQDMGYVRVCFYSSYCGFSWRCVVVLPLRHGIAGVNVWYTSLNPQQSGSFYPQSTQKKKYIMGFLC